MDKEDPHCSRKIFHPALVLPVVFVLLLVAFHFGFAPFVQPSYEPSTSATFFSIDGEGININEAGLEELMLLPGIGEVKAEAIIAYREQNGPFTTQEQLLEVNGIGPKTLNDMADMIHLGTEDIAV